MPANRYADAASADLARHERDHERRELEHEMAQERARGEALYNCMDGTVLKLHLNDADLCHPLAELFRCYEAGGDCKEQIRKLRERVVEIMLDNG
jgi:hypothetical protein